MSIRGRKVLKLWQDDENGVPWWLGWAFVGIVVALWANRMRQEREERSEFLLSTTWTETASPAILPDASSPVAIAEDIPIEPPAAAAAVEPEEPQETPADTVAVDEADEPTAISDEEQVAEEVAPQERPADDLTKLEGIGPKISSVLQAAGITTFAELAATDAEHVREIVRAAGLNLADPTTWPEQAGLAAAEDWDGLKHLQEKLKGGRPA